MTLKIYNYWNDLFVKRFNKYNKILQNNINININNNFNNLENICQYEKDIILKNYETIRKINNYLKLKDFNNNIWYIKYNNKGNIKEFTIDIKNKNYCLCI